MYNRSVSAAIIGGTVIGDLLRRQGGEEFQVATQFGTMSGLRRRDGIFVVARHGDGHKLPPHKVPYKAIGAGLIALGVDRCLSSAAVGSLHAELNPGELAAVSDFIDFTGRNVTMFELNVHHTDFTPGVSPQILDHFSSAGIERQVVYGCTNGPRYETPAEVNALRFMGADVVGMTVATEAIVMRELGIAYGSLAIVTNFAAGITGRKLSHEEVVKEVHRAANSAVDILLTVAQ
jgi:5'-methylthioadenosine phosphorylase